MWEKCQIKVGKTDLFLFFSSETFNLLSEIHQQVKETNKKCLVSGGFFLLPA